MYMLERCVVIVEYTYGCFYGSVVSKGVQLIMGHFHARA